MAAGWFEGLFGFRESDPETVQRNLRVDGARLISDANGASYGIGTLETPSVGELRARAQPIEAQAPIRVRNVVGEAKALHMDPDHAGAAFQVASQFNLLEMVDPDVTPECGVSGYHYDPTQGPACAVAAAAALIYRNYFAPVGGGVGQTADRQIDCLRDVHAALAGGGEALWEMRNGYALASSDQLRTIAARLEAMGEEERDAVRAALRVGVHRDVEVTEQAAGHTVTQVYCSALPVAYHGHTNRDWEPFARLVLEAAYEATLMAAAENAQRNPDAPVFLTQVGGGVFSNSPEWIHGAMRRAFDLAADSGLDVRIVHYREVNEWCRELERRRTG